MNRRAFVGRLTGGILALPLAAHGQPAARVWRIGYLALGSLVDPPSPERAAFLAGLRELGYVPGGNLDIAYRSADSDPQQLPFLADELVAAKVDAIVTTSVEAAQAAASASKTLPIIALGIGDPVASGLVGNLARPDQNVTGTSWQSIDIVGKRFGLLKETVPRATRIAYLWNPDAAMASASYSAARQAAPQIGFSLEELRVGNADELQRAMQLLERRRPDALVVVTDSRIATYRNIIAESALRLKLPTIAGYRGFVEAGGLMSYSASLSALYRRGAVYVDRVLHGARPRDLPVEQPTKFELVINMKTAKALGLAIPQSMLLRADEVIQ